MKNEKKIFEVDVLVYTTVRVPVEAKDEEDAREKVSDEVLESSSSMHTFKRMNMQDFIHHSFFDDYEYWSVREASADYIQGCA